MARKDTDLVQAHRAGVQDSAARSAVRSALVSRRAQASVDAQEGTGAPVTVDHDHGMHRMMALLRDSAGQRQTGHPGSKRGYQHQPQGSSNVWRAVTSQRRRSPGKFLTPARYR